MTSSWASPSCTRVADEAVVVGVCPSSSSCPGTEESWVLVLVISFAVVSTLSSLALDFGSLTASVVCLGLGVIISGAAAALASTSAFTWPSALVGYWVTDSSVVEPSDCVSSFCNRTFGGGSEDASFFRPELATEPDLLDG